MSNQQLVALLPVITLSSVILVQMMAIAFSRNLSLTVSISVIGLLLTALAFIPVYPSMPIVVTPLITLDGFAMFFSLLILLSSAAVTLLAYDYLRDRARPERSSGPAASWASTSSRSTLSPPKTGAAPSSRSASSCAGCGSP